MIVASLEIQCCGCFGARISAVGRLAEASNNKIVAIGTIQAQNVENRDSLRGVDYLPNSQNRLALGDAQKFRGPLICGSGVDFFVGIAEFYVRIIRVFRDRYFVFGTPMFSPPFPISGT